MSVSSASDVVSCKVILGAFEDGFGEAAMERSRKGHVSQTAVVGNAYKTIMEISEEAS